MILRLNFYNFSKKIVYIFEILVIKLYNLKYILLNDISKILMPYLNIFILMMIYVLLPYSKKKSKNINRH